MSWLLGLFGLCWKSEAEFWHRESLSFEAQNMLLGQDVYRLEMNVKSLEKSNGELRDRCILMRDEIADLELGADDDEDDEDFDEDFDDDFDDDDDDWDDEDDYEDEDDDE